MSSHISQVVHFIHKINVGWGSICTLSSVDCDLDKIMKCSYLSCDVTNSPNLFVELFLQFVSAFNQSNLFGAWLPLNISPFHEIVQRNSKNVIMPFPHMELIIFKMFSFNDWNEEVSPNNWHKSLSDGTGGQSITHHVPLYQSLLINGRQMTEMSLSSLQAGGT